MPRTLMSAALAAGLGVMPLAAQAASVTLDFEAAQFDTLILAGSPILEDGFEIATISGNVFGIAVFGGVQGQSLFVGYRNAPSIGDTLEITRADGGLFNVTEFDFASNAGDLSDAVDIVGLRGTTKTGELLGVSSNSSFATQSGSVFGTIDTLRFVVSGVGAASLRLDNFDVELAPIPLPAGGWLMLAGLGALGAVGRRRSLKASRLGLLSKKGPTPMKTCALIAAALLAVGGIATTADAATFRITGGGEYGGQVVSFSGILGVADPANPPSNVDITLTSFTGFTAGGTDFDLSGVVGSFGQEAIGTGFSISGAPQGAFLSQVEDDFVFGFGGDLDVFLSALTGPQAFNAATFGVSSGGDIEFRTDFEARATLEAVAPIPLPAAAWMLMAGLGALGVAGRRRVKS